MVTSVALASEYLTRVVVIAIGDDATSIGTAVFGGQSPRLHSVSTEQVDTAGLATKVSAQLRAVGSASQSDALPALVVLAGTAQADCVADVIAGVRSQMPRTRPRVWPTFVTGSATELGGFDQRLDELGAGACDVVLVMLGQPDVDSQSAALNAWLQIKVPAPASVLADLPDVDGHACRYVALGAQRINEMSITASDADVVDVEAVDVNSVVGEVNARLRAIARESAVVKVAGDAANSLCAAAEHFDVPALLQAENNFMTAVNDVNRGLPSSLEDQLVSCVKGSLANVSGATDDDQRDDAEGTTPSEPTDLLERAERTELVSTLVQLASKGSMSRVFKRSRMAGLAEQIAVATRRDIDRAVANAVGHVLILTESHVLQELEDQARLRTAAMASERIEAGNRLNLAWQERIEATRRDAKVWTAVDGENVRRSWGGGIPAPREYVVSASSSVISLSESDRAMTVIDLRETSGPDSAADGTSQPRSATVLVAQYGLPLSALK